MSSLQSRHKSANHGMGTDRQHYLQGTTSDLDQKLSPFIIEQKRCTKYLDTNAETKCTNENMEYEYEETHFIRYDSDQWRFFCPSTNPFATTVPSLPFIDLNRAGTSHEIGAIVVT